MSSSVKVVSFYWKLLHGLWLSNSILKHMGKVTENVCSFGCEVKDSMSHQYWNCVFVKSLLAKIERKMNLAFAVENYLFNDLSDGDLGLNYM